MLVRVVLTQFLHECIAVPAATHLLLCLPGLSLRLHRLLPRRLQRHHLLLHLLLQQQLLLLAL